MKRKLIFRKTLLIISTLMLPVIFGSAFVDLRSAFKSVYSPRAEVPALDSTDKEKAKEVKGCLSKDSIEYYYYTRSPGIPSNNKFGLYIYAEVGDYFELAQNLVNSNGGDWGYVLIPFNVKDRDYTKWRKVFEKLNNKHLIPIVQLHDVDTDKYEVQTKEAAEFLNVFVWPIKQKYISVYNEVNDAKFWYGRVDPVEYAKILDYTVKAFKEENTDFFMLNGAFNVSAPSNTSYMDSFEYMRRMNGAVPGIFNKLDGWASHPYPQPNFSGSPYDRGRFSIRAYEAELDFLKKTLGVSKNLPVFITETGWAHAEGENYNSGFLPVNKVSEYFKVAFEEVWLKDERVVAVTPFTIWYNPPFDHFTWVNRNNVPYEHFEVVKSIKKVNGNPERLTLGTIDMTECD